MSYSFEPNGGLGPHGRPQAAARVALAVNGMGSFTRDLAGGEMRYDRGGLAVMGFRPGEFDGRLGTLG